MRNLRSSHVYSTGHKCLSDKWLSIKRRVTMPTTSKKYFKNIHRRRLQFDHQRVLPGLRHLPHGHGPHRGTGHLRRCLQPEGQGAVGQQHLDQHRLQIREVHWHPDTALPQQRRPRGKFYWNRLNFLLKLYYWHRKLAWLYFVMGGFDVNSVEVARTIHRNYSPRTDRAWVR